MNAPLLRPGLIRPGAGSGSSVSRRSLIKYFGAGAAALGATPLLAGCGGDAEASASGDFGVAAFPGDAYFLDTANLAEKQYAKHGLNVPEHLTPQSGVQGLQLLVAGAIDGFAVDTLLLLASHGNAAKGKRPMLVGVRNMETTYAIVGNKNVKWPDKNASFEEKMHALKGKKVGVTAIGAGSDLQLKLALETAGMVYDDITPLAVGSTTQMIPNMRNERVDAVVTVQWTSTRLLAQATGGSILLDFAEKSAPDIMRNQAVVCASVREDMLEKDPESVKAWLATQNDARKWMLENPKDAAALLNKTGLAGKGLPIAEEYMKHYAKVVDPALEPMLKAPKDIIERMIGLAERFGNIEKGKVTYESLVPDFARA